MRGIDGDSRKNKRPDGVADAFQVRKHLVEAHADVPSNILSNDPSGPVLVHDPKHFRPEVAVIARADSLPGKAKGLAWVSAANKVNWSVMFKRPHVVVDWYVGPMLRKHSPGIRVNLAEPHSGHPGPL
jgi:hypothetical protein